MPSPSDGRVVSERGLRVAALAALAVLAWRVGLPPARTTPTASTATLRQALARATREGTASLDLTLDSVPGPAERDWMRALSHAGTIVRYASTAGAQGPVVALDRLSPPGAGVRLSLLNGGAATQLHDSVGALGEPDSAGTSARSVDALPAGMVQLRTRAGIATVMTPTAVQKRVILVTGRAGWEGKFVIAALEETGWKVESDLVVNSRAAGASVSVTTPGARGPIDTARVAAVVVLDSTTTWVANIVSFVRSGGGLVMLPDAVGEPALARLAPASNGATVNGSLGAILSAQPQRGLDRVTLRDLRQGAVPVERLGQEVTAAARREGLGRVLQLGFRDTWRWRMEGPDGAPSAHAAWWSRMVGAVAIPPSAPAPVFVDDPAPYAALVSALGPPTVLSPVTPVSSLPLEAVLLVLACSCLIAEFASRRFRGMA